MRTHTVRQLLYLENALVFFSAGVFLTLPLYLKQQGYSEVLFAKIFAAGIFGTLLCVASNALLIRRFGLARLAPCGSLLFAVGSLLFHAVVIGRMPEFAYYLASLVQGIGWGFFFTQGPICMSTTVDDKTRSYYFTLYGAYGSLGYGLAPILASLATNHLGASYGSVFLTATLLSLVASALSMLAAANAPNYPKAEFVGSKRSAAETLAGLKQIFKLPSVYFFAMVFAISCVYTSMMNFQTTFAAAQGIDYTVFYACYTFAVVLSRFTLSKPLAALPVGYVLPRLIGLTVISLCLLAFARESLTCYAGGSLLLGVSYGMAYPILQAQAANYAPEHLRPQVLVSFSFAYLVARYMFPYIGAHIVVASGYGALLGVLGACVIIELLLALYFYSAVAPQPSTFR